LTDFALCGYEYNISWPALFYDVIANLARNYKLISYILQSATVCLTDCSIILHVVCNLVHCAYLHKHHEDVLGNGDIVPRIANLGTR
jgi:hypothetical protein